MTMTCSCTALTMAPRSRCSHTRGLWDAGETFRLFGASTTEQGTNNLSIVECKLCTSILHRRHNNHIQISTRSITVPCFPHAGRQHSHGRELRHRTIGVGRDHTHTSIYPGVFKYVNLNNIYIQTDREIKSVTVSHDPPENKRKTYTRTCRHTHVHAHTRSRCCLSVMVVTSTTRASTLTRTTGEHREG